MDRDQMIEIAKQAGIDVNWIPKIPQLPDFLERFAQLVAAHEREEAAKLCDRFSKESHFTGHAFAGEHLAQKIRART